MRSITWLRGALHWLVALDEKLTAFLTLPKGDLIWRKVAILIAHLADAALWLLLALVALLSGDKVAREVVWQTAVVTFVATGVATLVKFLVRRERPAEVDGLFSIKYDPYSFPSGHVTRLASITGVVGASYPSCASPLYILTLFVALSRVALGIHYLSDGLAGLAIGLAFAWCILAIL